jgi:tetratricopeptide (TPR) repeat protein
MGKTRLLHEFVERCSAPIRIARGECTAYGAAAPYQPFIGIVQRLLEFVTPDGVMADETSTRATFEATDPTLVPHLPALIHLLGWPTQTALQLAGETLQRSVAEAITELLLASAKRQPTLILLEDWHWADEGSRQLLWQIARILSDAALLVVVSHRPGAATNELPATLRVRLEPLTRECTSDMAQSVLACEALSPRLLARIHEHTEGNPFFVEEFCRSLREEGFPSTGLPADFPIPEGVQAVVRARLDRLNDADADVLRHAAIFGNDFTARLLSQLMVGSDGLGEALSRLENLGLLRRSAAGPEPVYHFNHSVTRDVTYETLLVRQRRDLHAAVARLLEADADTDSRRLEERIEALAYHYGASKIHRRAAQYAELAGDKAARNYSLEQARQQYRAAIEHLDELEPTEEHVKRRIDVSLKWAQACLFKPAPENIDVLKISYECAERIGYTRGAARSLYWMGWLEYALGQQQEAIEYLHRCMKLAEQINDERLVAQLHLNLGQSFAAATDYRQALRWLNLGIGLKRERGSNPPDMQLGSTYGGGGLAYSLGYLALIHGDIGQFESAYTELEIALSMVRARGTRSLEGSITTQLGMVQLWQGDFEKSLETAQRMQEIGEQVNGPYILAMSQTIAGYANCQTGRRDMGLLQLREAASWLQSHAIKLTLSWNFGCLAEALALAGRYDEAREAANRALERAHTWDRLGEVMAHRALGIADTRAGNLDLAHTHFEAALRRASAKESPRDMAITCVRWADALIHAPERAKSLCSEALIFFEGAQMTFYAELARARLDTLNNELMPTRIERIRSTT